MTNKTRSALLLFATIVAVSYVAPSAKADEWNKETVVSFSAPVELQGEALPAGTYVFKLLDSQTDRDIVEVFTHDRSHLLTTFIAVPKTRRTPAHTTVLTLQEQSIGTPEVITSWFYAGDTLGLEFAASR